MNLDNIISFNTILFISSGMVCTLVCSIASVFFGFIIGIILAACKLSDRWYLRCFANFYTSVFRGTPMLLQLTIIYFGLSQVIQLEIMFAAILTFSLNSGAYVSEIIRGGIM